jgi:GntR family transcriptional repressor for pyruvate dehydrogenase complex
MGSIVMQTPLPPTKLVKRTLVEQVVEHVQSFVLTQNLKPGDILPSEMRFTEILGVSRPVVREALRTLAGRGVLTITNGRNAMVSPVNATALIHFFERATQLNAVSVIELLEVRLGIEVQSCALAALRRDAADILLLEQNIQELEQQRYKIDAYSILDAQLHRRIAAASKNEMLAYFVESLSGGLQMTSLVGLQQRRSRDELDAVHHDHVSLVRKIIDGDSEGASRTMHQHVNAAILAMQRDPEQHA